MLRNGANTSRVSRGLLAGFALPTVLIASTIMMTVLLLSVQANTAVRADLLSQYYNQQARFASQSGVARAQQCLAANGSTATWSDAKPLMPNTDCSGNVVGGYPSYVLSTSSMRTSFSVPAPVMSNGTQRISVNGKVELLRTSSNTVWRTYNQALVTQTGASVNFSTVTFGYYGDTGAFFATIGVNGDANTLGQNSLGQLGTGDTTSGTTPRPFVLPTGMKASQMYTNFVSQGQQMFALTTAGDVYGAGLNTQGQLGNGIMSASAALPSKFNLPLGVKATYVGVLGYTTYVIGDDNNIYATGACMNGLLGSNYTIAGCTDRSSYVRVNLPTPNLSDPNTLPVASPGSTPATNMVLDKTNTYVRMQGGRVYGWGSGDLGELGTGGTSDSSTPVQVGTYGNAGQPKATQLAFDGLALYILDDSGKVQTVGDNRFGELAGAAAHIQHNGTGMCINNAGNSSTTSRATLYSCVTAQSELAEFNPNGTIIFRPTSSINLCLDIRNASYVNGQPVDFYPCTPGAPNEQWVFRDDGSIYNPTSGMCLDDFNNTNGNDTPLDIWTCVAGSPNQQFSLPISPYLTPVPLPGTVAQIATDQWSVLFRMTNGDVWGAGGNDRGQLGNGASGKNIGPNLTKMILPGGRTATYLYTMKTDLQGSDFANSFVVLDDGSVWGCGANTFGQLGIGSVSATVATPVKMNLPAGVLANIVQTGLGTTVVLTTAGSIYTVGNNANGQLGDGTTTNSSTPKANKYTNVVPLVLF